MISKREIVVGFAALMLPKAAWAADSIRVPLSKTEDGQLNVQVTINGQGPFTFRVNVGAGLASISASLANKLRLQLIGDGLQPYAVTVGSQTYPAFRVNAANVLFGDALKRNNLVFMRVPTQAFAGLGFDGMIGSALTLSKPSILDFEESEIRVYPDGQMPLEGFQPVAATIKRSGVYTSAVSVTCRFAGQTASLGANMTGRDGISLMPSYVRDNKLWDAFPDYIEHGSDSDNSPNDQWDRFHDFVIPQKNPDKTVWRVAKVKDFSIGSFVFDEVEIRMPHPEQEDVADNKAGFVGGDIMSRFTIAFGDKDQLWLKPNGRFKGRIS